ncbi:MAG: amidohydrolase family protein [Bacillota bacterium]|nr:amidohydrolase family protein [Bacillota bacterium]
MKENLKLINCNIRNPKNDYIIRDAAVLINNQNRTSAIEYIGSIHSMPQANNYKVVDLSGKYIFPGLINAHCHLFGNGKPIKSISSEFSKNLIVKVLEFPIAKALLLKKMKGNINTELNSGVTTLRTMGDFHNLDVRIRNDISNGILIGPQMITSGRGITVINGHASEYALSYNSIEEARDCVKKCIKNKVNAIKIFSTGGVLDSGEDGEIGQTKMSLEEMKAICDEAHNAGLLVASHVVCKKGVREALLAGVDTIEHGAEMDDEIVELFKNNPRTLRGYSSLIPTLFPAAILSELNTDYTKISEGQREKAKVILNRIIKSLQRAIEEKIKVGLGNDASVPFVTHYDLWREIEIRIKLAGVSPIDALYQATQANADILGIGAHTGSVEVGKRADFIILEGDPVQDIRYLSKPQIIFIDGQVIANPKFKRYEDIDQIINKVDWN